MRFLYFDPIGAKNFAYYFSINITRLRSLKALILLVFYKKTYLYQMNKGSSGMTNMACNPSHYGIKYAIEKMVYLGTKECVESILAKRKNDLHDILVN